MIDLKDLYWAAGFLDGEGSFVYKKTRNSGVCVSAPQKGRELLDKLVDLFGGNIYERPNVFQWQLGGERAVGLMMTLYSLMSTKRKAQIAYSLTNWRRTPLSPTKHIALFGKCRNGHEWIEANITIEKDGKRCRLCLNNRVKTYRQSYYMTHKDTIKEQSKVNKAKRKLADSSNQDKE